MKQVIQRMAGLLLALGMVLGNIAHASAAASAYYVSPTGNDANPGTASAPFRTFAKANSVLKPGSTLNIYAGVYNQQLKITKSGTGSAGITVQPVGGTVVIDRQNAASAGVEVRASFVTLKNLTVRNAADICVTLAGTDLTVIGLVVHSCFNNGIQANNSSNIRILNSAVYNTVTSNSARALASGWGSAIKVRLSNNVLIEGNSIYNNYGEGIGTRGTNITIRGNKLSNNFSVNIYTNSENATIERNFVYCTPNSGFERGGLPPVGIGLGEEYFEGWGARLKNARVINNIVAFCRHGVRYYGADDGVPGGGLKNAVIAYNTLYGSTNAALSIVYESAQAGSLVANNIIWQAKNNLTAIDNPAGIAFKHNLWKVAPAAAYRGPGDRYGDPKFAAAPSYTAESYRPASISPAATTALDIGIARDFYAQARGPQFDMGAIQFFNATVSASTQGLTEPAATLSQPTGTPPPATPQSTASPIPPTVQPSSTSVPVTPVSIEPTSSPTALPPTSVPAQPSATPTALPAQPGGQETRYDNRHTAFVYSANWVEEVSPYALEGSFARTSTNGASLTFAFTGQSFSIVYKGGPSYRKMDVYVDDVLVGTIDERHDVSTYKARWDSPGTLSPGQHTLKLVFVTTGSSTNGSVDAVLVR